MLWKLTDEIVFRKYQQKQEYQFEVLTLFFTEIWTCMQCHWWLESTFPNRGFVASAIFPRHVTTQLFSVSAIKKGSERTIHECRGSHSTSEVIMVRGIEKWFPWMLSQALQTLAKVCHCPGELLSKKFCVNRQVIYFYVMNKFLELFEGTFWYWVYLIKHETNLPHLTM